MEIVYVMYFSKIFPKEFKVSKTIPYGGDMIRPFVLFISHFHFEEIITAPWSEFYKRLKSANVSWTKMFWFHGCTSQNVAPAYYYNCRNMDFIKSVACIEVICLLVH